MYLQSHQRKLRFYAEQVHDWSPGLSLTARCDLTLEELTVDWDLLAMVGDDAQQMDGMACQSNMTAWSQ